MRYYVVDAFADRVFEGNPAGVCVMDKWLPDRLMRLIAMENNLSETAFAVREGDGYRLRWFTPGSEIDLCGHATLGTAFIIMEFVEPPKTRVQFQTVSGPLGVIRKDGLYEMDFPVFELRPVAVTDQMEAVIGAKPVEAWMGRDLVCIMESEELVRTANPDGKGVLSLDGMMLHLTAKSTEYDCVTRSFGPKFGIEEDPVCGSGHCHIAPLWSGKLGKKNLEARQASRRGGTLFCTTESDRIRIAGKATLYATADIHIESLIDRA